MSNYKLGDVVEFIGSKNRPRGLTFRHREDIVVLKKRPNGRYLCIGKALFSASNLAVVKESWINGPVKENLIDSGSLIFKYLDVVGQENIEGGF